MHENIRIVFLFICCVAGFIAAYYLSADIGQEIKSWLKEQINNRPLSSFLVESARLFLGVVVAVMIAVVVSRIGLTRVDTVKKLYLEPIRSFFHRHGRNSALIILLLIGTYRISDIVLGVISNVFYQDVGFSKVEIAQAAKTFGLFMTILGGFLGGMLSFRFGVLKILLLGAIMSSATNLLFMVLANMGYSPWFLYVTITLDNISGGLASAAFVAFLSTLTNIKFTAMQFAIFTSLMTLLPKILGGYSGSMVNLFGYSNFFIFTAVLGIPVIGLILWIIGSDILSEKSAPD